jgi:hypothetical protein
MSVIPRMIPIGVLLTCCAVASAQTSKTAPRAADPGYDQWSKATRYNKSWIEIDWSVLQSPLVEGDRIQVPVEYSLDPSEHYRSTTLTLEALGPRIPRPDAPKPVSFQNTQHLYYGSQSVKVAPGGGRHVFLLTIPRSSPQNWLLLIARFSDDRGRGWPWDVRASTWYARKGGFYELETDKPGNLFTYAEPVRLVATLKNVRTPGEQKVVKYKVYDYTKAMVAEGSVPFKVERNGQKVPVSLDLTRRGTFLLQAEVDGWEPRETMFCRIPDLAAIIGGKPTRLGFTSHSAPAMGHRTQEMFEVARRLGLTSCRAFTEWTSIEPGPGHFALQHWDPFFAAARATGVETVITIYDPPPWALLDRGRHVGYQMFASELRPFQEMVTTVTKRYKGKFWGWEWLNEITPGGTPDYASEYVKLCRAGVEAARAVDPSLHSVLAGGLWPRGFRLDVLNAGAGAYVDVLPIHYANGAGVAEAREDLNSYGHPRAAVWENESCAFDIQWNCPGLDWVSATMKSHWVLTQWTDELAAGCEKLIYFGGEGATTGYGDYLLSDFTPLPVGATLAVFAAKTFDVQPTGVFSTPDQATVFHLFERDGKPILVAATTGQASAEIPLAVGAPSLQITDYQGTETELPVTGGLARLPLGQMPVFVEGANLDVLKANLVPAVGSPAAAGKRGATAGIPQISLLSGKPGALPVRLKNVYAAPLAGTLRLDLPAGWMREPAVSFSLRPGEDKTLAVPVTVPGTTRAESSAHQLTVNFDRTALPVVIKPFSVSVIAPENVGNLLKNGGFEQLERDGKTPTHWRGSNAQVVSSNGLGLGHGKHVLKFANATNWANYGQSVKLAGGSTYLYTAWIWNQGMEGGSNINQTMKDGSSRSLYDNQVINMGDNTPSWQVFTCRYQAPANLAEAGFVPVVKGAGTAFYDNIRVTAFEGSDFAAEAIKVSQPPVIDGKLDDWHAARPIPLIGKNQCRQRSNDYRWTPVNLSGVAYLAWQADSLYVAVEVLDQVDHPSGDDETVIDGDSVILAFDPTNRSSSAAAQSSAYYASARKPGGSGAHTLWRSSQHTGGRPAGHLARDSSVHEIAVAAAGGRCVYELRIPWSELSISPAFGGKFGFAVQLNDNDGNGPAAQMNWGGGLSPAWSPTGFGIITLVE